MKKDKLSAWTLLGISLTVLLISLLTTGYLFSSSQKRLLQVQLESSKREAREIGKILEQQLQSGMPREQVAANLQRSIENTDVQMSFICMYDTSGREICHPDPSRIGQVIGEGNSVVKDVTGEASHSFFELLNQGKAQGGVRTFARRDRGSEIIYVYPVPGSPWMVAAHANIQTVHQQLLDMRDNFMLTYAVSGMLIVGLSFAVVRWLGSRYEQQLESERDSLAEEVKNLAILNADLVAYQAKMENRQPESPVENSQPGAEEVLPKRRMLTYWKDQLISIEVERISFFYTQHSLTYIHCLDESVYSCNDSLDELHKYLDPAQFFRANRQFIISIRAIDKIFQYGKYQLKLSVRPAAPEELIISKNKVAEFKQWLNS